MERPFIDKRIYDLKEPMIYGRSSDLTYRPADTLPERGNDPAYIFDALKASASMMIVQHKVECPHKTQSHVHVQSAFIYQRRPIVVGLLFTVEDGKPVFPQRAAGIRIISQQLGANWN